MPNNPAVASQAKSQCAGFWILFVAFAESWCCIQPPILNNTAKDLSETNTATTCIFHVVAWAHQQMSKGTFHQKFCHGTWQIWLQYPYPCHKPQRTCHKAGGSLVAQSRQKSYQGGHSHQCQPNSLPRKWCYDMHQCHAFCLLSN